MTSRNTRITIALVLAALAVPVAINWAGWNLHAVWHFLLRRRPHGERVAAIGATVAALAVLLASSPALAQSSDYDFEPINYASTAPADPLATLKAKLDAGDAELVYDPTLGYLPALLEALDINPHSQMLVYSKTSFQLRRISPRTPRAIYFNDSVYVGYVPGGDVLEISAVDPQLGGIYYTLNQTPRKGNDKKNEKGENENENENDAERIARPVITRRTGECLQCHASSMTQSVPGHMVRSVHTDTQGYPILTATTHVTTHRSPVEERWGGWYVTGTHGRMTHLGNVTIPDGADAQTYDYTPGQNVTDITDRIVESLYPHAGSDIVALMVLEHQAQMQNLITRAAYQTRIALAQQADFNRMADRPADFMTDSTRRRIERHGEALLRYLLFVDEAYLKDPIKGTTDFADRFQSLGPSDAAGRSLRQLDLTRYLFEYPCSYLIYSPQFDAMPPQMKGYIYARLFDILTGRSDREGDADFLISTDDRRAIYQILLETKPDLPPQWTAANTP